MQMVGINDPSHFSRDFTRHHGIAPSRVRRAGLAAPRTT
jgi:AraC-like DNA-binding protein